MLSSAPLAPPRARWYLGSILAALAGGGLTVLVYRQTNVGYPFIAGCLMLLALLGGRGPSLVAGLGTLLVACLLTQSTIIYTATRADVLRSCASVALIVGASFLGERWRLSRLAAADRESSVREAASPLEELLEGLTDGVLLTDATYHVTYANAQLQAMLGMSREQLIGHSWTELQALAVVRDVQSELSSLAERRSVLTELLIRRADGSAVTVEASIRLLPGGRVLASLRDISERRSAEERQQAERKQREDELRQAQNMESVGRLAGGIAHDFNNLLTVIIGHAELLAMDVPATGEFAESIEQILSASESGSALTRQLLGFARKQVVAPQSVDVNGTVRRLPTLIRRLLSDGVALDVMLDERVGYVRIDPAQLDEVLMNLTLNAMDAMPSGGQLQLSTSCIAACARTAELAAAAAGPLVEIQVTDTGYGMNEEVRRRAFEPFFTTKAHGMGTGLGLATSYGIISQAGGVILIDSAPGRGTRVRLLLPAVDGPRLPVPEAETVPAVDAPSGTGRLGQETVLVVDDEEHVRRITAESLRRLGYIVLTADSGTSAIERSRGEPGRIDLLVTDVVMPGMNGRELADILLRERSAMRVLFVSGYTGGAIEQHGVIEAGLSFLQKPFDRAALARQVRSVLDAAPSR